MATSDTGEPPLDVLTVGDGNFSFSLAFLRRRRHTAVPALVSVRLVATSFDSREELEDKYPESARVCAQLRALGATVLHRVDAANLEVSLHHAMAAADKDDEKVRPARRFDRIVFNHPHCGEENVARHQSLLSHFFVAAQRLLKRGGRIHVTLADGQPERWQARERAGKAGLRLVDEIHDVDAHEEHGVSYDRKRHQNGRSFHRVLLHGERKEQVSTLFVFAVAAAANGDHPQAAAVVSASTSLVALQPTRKRKLRGEDGAAPTQAFVANSFACEPCAKAFKTAQGLKTHVHMVHELGVAGSPPTGAQQAKTPLPCGQCVRSFKNEDARRQHQISKHGDDATIQPDWFRPVAVPPSKPTVNADEAATSTKVCSICELVFPDQRSLDAHWQELQPNAVTRRVCSLCGKGFDEERALRQHQNFCRIKAAAPSDVSR